MSAIGSREWPDFTAPPSDYPYKRGKFFIGGYLDGQGQQHFVGIQSDRHAITVGGSRTGKGVSVIIPNLRLWPHNVLVIDPKGEAASLTYETREAMGQAVHVIDPFNAAKVPSRLRAQYNPLDWLDPKSVTIKEDIQTITDGLVMRSDKNAEHWDGGAGRIISGLIAYVLMTAPEESRNLLEVRRIIRNMDRFDAAIEAMRDMEGCGGLAESGASAAHAKEGGYFVSGADKNTEWLDSEAMQFTLGGSSFSLDDLKRGNASVYLVLPPKRIAQGGRFLRLFVRCAIDAMMTEMPDGSDKGESCLFLLDEFFALGYINEVAVSAGLMAGYGLQMWPILQDIGQLTKLYDRDGAETFFGNADLQQFFGNSDFETLEFISRRIGNFNVDDLPDEPVEDRTETNRLRKEYEDTKRKYPNQIGKRQGIHARAEMERNIANEIYKRNLARFQTEASRVLGRPRMTPDQIAALVRRREGDAVARKQVAFVEGLRPLVCDLTPFFEWDATPSERPSPSKVMPQPVRPQPDVSRPTATAQAVATPVSSKAGIITVRVLWFGGLIVFALVVNGIL